MVVTATEWEGRAVRRALRREIGRGLARVETCGIGPDAAARLCARLESEPAPERLALVGWAGGLAPGLDVGHVVVADCALDEAGRRAPCLALELAGARIGPVLTVAEALCDPAAKRATALASGALAVEMEAYPLAAWAAERGIPFLHLRLISDGPDDALPDHTPVLDPLGRLRPAALMARPRLALSLARLALRLARLQRRLGDLARVAVTAGG